MRSNFQRPLLIAAALFFLLPALASAADLININTADVTLLDTLPGIGPTYAKNIVDYRTQHGPFVRVEDIQNVSGIGPATYAKISPFITASGGVSNPSPSVATASSSSETGGSPSGGASAYVPPPAALSIDAGADRVALLEVPAAFTAKVTMKGGALDLGARVRWSFGDGSSGEGRETQKTYRYAGAYLVVATASDGETIAHDEFTVTVKPAAARISAITGEGITIANESDERLDLSSWRLVSGTGFFRIPDGMAIGPESTAFLPFSVTNLPIAFDAALAYPDGIVAARYAPPLAPPVQPPLSTTSSHPVQAVETITSQGTPVQPHAEAVLAPAATSTLAAAGVAVAPASAPASTSRLALLKSPWTLSLLGVIALAGGAFILL